MDTRNTVDPLGHDPEPGPNGPSFNGQRLSDDQKNKMRLAGEAALLALCAYLLGVAGLPPLFDPPNLARAGSLTEATQGADVAEGNGAVRLGDSVDGSTADTEPAGAAAVDPATADGAETATVEAVDLRPGAGVSVVVARADWSTGYFQAALFKALLEELGYIVSEPSAQEHKPKDVYPMIAQGQIDFWTNTWSPIHTSFLEQTLDDGTVISSRVSRVGNLLPASGLEGIVINASVADENQILSLAQINDDPNLVALFDTDGNGKAEIHGCPDGWGCADVINETIEFNNWGNLEQIQDDYNDMVAESIARVESGTPTLQYTWSPSGYLTSLRPGDNVQWLSLGDRENVLDGSITPDRDFNDAEPPPLGEACTADPCWLGWVAADIGVTARNDFLDANPAARALFEQARLKVLDVALANVKYDTGETSEDDVARHAQEWITANRDVVDTWLAAARAVG